MQSKYWESLELRHLVTLQAIAELGSFSAAADRLDCSPSALSQQIAALEASVGHRLLERSRGRRHVVLTEPGQLLVRHAEAIVARLRAAHADLTAFDEGGVGSLRIGTYQSVGTKILPGLLREFAAEWPNVELRLTEGANDDALLQLVERGELDLTFSVLPMPSGPFEAIELMRDPYVLAVPADSVLAPSGAATLRQIGALQLVGFKSCRTIAQVEEYLRGRGIQPNIVFRSDDNGIVQAMVAAGVGCALVPMLALNENDPAIRILELENMPPRVLALAWHRDRYRSPAAAAFVRRSQDICARLAADAAARTAGRREPRLGVAVASGAGTRRPSRAMPVEAGRTAQDEGP